MAYTETDVDLLSYARPIAVLPQMQTGVWSVGWREAGANSVVYARSPVGSTINLWLRDLRTGRERALFGLSHTIGFHKHGALEVSPDGHRAIWHDEQGGIRLATLDGRNVERLPGFWALSEFAWIDARHYLVVRWSLDDDRRGSVEVRQVGRRAPLNASTVRTAPRPMAVAWATEGLQALSLGRLTPPDTDHGGTFESDSGGPIEPTVSPAEAWRNGRELWLAPTDGTRAHRVGLLPSASLNEDDRIEWAPHGRAIVFAQGTTLYRLGLRPGAPGTLAAPSWARIFDVPIFVGSETDLERRLGPAAHLVGGHSNSGRHWRSPKVGDVVADGFELRNDDYALEYVAVTDWPGVLGSAPYDRLRVGMSPIDALACLTRDLPNLAVKDDEVRWTADVRPSVAGFQTLFRYEAILGFDEHGLAALTLRAGYVEERGEARSSAKRRRFRSAT